MTQFEQTRQWHNGAESADYLDLFFAGRGWAIEPTTPYEERDLCLGDRRFTSADRTLFIEYKADRQTARTGNIFLETVSVDTQDKPGWAYTCQADYLFYAIWPIDEILIWKPHALRDRLPDLKLQFGSGHTTGDQNPGYRTHGLIVPLQYAEINLCCQVMKCHYRPA